jgi:hypothetical protein
MMNKKSKATKKCKPIILIFNLTILLSANTNLKAQPLDKTQFLNLLVQNDALVRSDNYNKAISFTVVRPASLADPVHQGFQSEHCVMAKKDGAEVMKVGFDYEKEFPVYVPPQSEIWDASLDYDSKGRLLVWRKVEKYIYSGSDMNKTIKVIRPYYVHPDGNTVDIGNDHANVSIYPIGNDENVSDIFLFHLVTGRGFTKLINNLVSLDVLPTGNITAKAQTSISPETFLNLTIDPNSDYLVRTAKYMFSGQDDPSGEITNTGNIIRNGVTYAKSGLLKTGSTEITIQINDEEPKLDDVYNEVLNYMKKPLDPQRTSIIDHRGEKPVMRKPTEEEINTP